MFSSGARAPMLSRIPNGVGTQPPPGHTARRDPSFLAIASCRIALAELIPCGNPLLLYAPTAEILLKLPSGPGLRWTFQYDTKEPDAGIR